MTEFSFQTLDFLTEAVKNHQNDKFCFFISFYKTWQYVANTLKLHWLYALTKSPGHFLNTTHLEIEKKTVRGLQGHGMMFFYVKKLLFIFVVPTFVT